MFMLIVEQLQKVLDVSIAVTTGSMPCLPKTQNKAKRLCSRQMPGLLWTEYNAIKQQVVEVKASDRHIPAVM